jgi:hypothetical protein
MAHAPKPFFRTARNAWFVQLGKRQVKLCEGPKSPQTEQAAWTQFHRLMASSPATPKAGVASPAAGLSVAEVFEKYLDWCQRHRSPRTYEWARTHIQSFCDHLRVARTLPARDLRPFHLVEWVDSKPTWGPNHRRGGVVASWPSSGPSTGPPTSGTSTPARSVAWRSRRR